MIRLLEDENALDQFDADHPKYILDWNDTERLADGTKLYRIIYKDGTKEGGYIASYDNLSQEGTCKVTSRGIMLGEVYGNARVYGNAQVECSRIGGNAQVYGNAQVKHGGIYEDAQVYGNADVDNFDGLIKGRARIFGNASIHNSDIYGSAQVYDNALVLYSKVSGNALVYGDAKVLDNSHVYGKAKVYDSVELFGCKVGGNAIAHGSGQLSDEKLSNHDEMDGNHVQFRK